MNEEPAATAFEAATRVPWAISDVGLKLILAIASRGEFFDEVRQEALSARNGAPLDNSRAVTKRGNVAVIPVRGPMFRHANAMTRVSGATSYASLRTDLQAALDAEDVKSILLEIDSPGGEVNGVAELAEAVYAARAQKRVVAYVGGTGASAAYWLAAAADTIVAAQTAELGSIGVIMGVVDDSKAREAAGERVITFVSSVSPNKRPNLDSKDGRAKVQQRVDDLGAVFVDAIARYRAVTADAVLDGFGKGDVFIASRAVQAGMVDRVGDFESIVQELNGRGSSSSAGQAALAVNGEPTMKKIAMALGLAADASEEALAAAAAQLKASAAENAALAAAAATTADEQKAINARLEQGLKALSDERDTRATAEWKSTLKAKVDEFTISPAEAAEQEKLTGAERDVAGRLLALRQVGALKPAAAGNPTVAGAGTVAAANGKGTIGEGLGAPQIAAIEAFKKENPGVDDMAAFTGAMIANPGLFTHEGA